MLEKLGITELRKQLKFYLEHVAGHMGHIYQTGDALILSPSTLALLQQRYAVNQWAKSSYQSLHLDQYQALTAGSITGKLPLDRLIGLSALFQLVQELTDILARPGAKENAPKWTVQPYVREALEGLPQESHGKFDMAYAVTVKLFGRGMPLPMEHGTLDEYLRCIAAYARADQERLETGSALEEGAYWGKVDGMDNAQARCMFEIIEKLSLWASSLIRYQVLKAGDGTVPDGLYLQFRQILQWYQDYVGSLPGTFRDIYGQVGQGR